MSVSGRSREFQNRSYKGEAMGSAAFISVRPKSIQTRQNFKAEIQHYEFNIEGRVTS